MFKKAARKGTASATASARALSAVKKSQRILEAAAAHDAADVANLAAITAVQPSSTHSSSVFEESFSDMVDTFCAMSTPYSDTDDVLAKLQVREVWSDAALSVSWPPPAAKTVSQGSATVITHRSFAASLVCPKKFYLLQSRPDLIPKLSVGDAVHLDDSVGFNELARRWDRLQFGSKGVVIQDRDFDCAVQHTKQVVCDYFATQYASLGEQAPSLTIHRPAFAAPFGGDRSDPRAAHPLVLRSRPCVLRFRPRDNQWTLMESQAVVDPLGTPARTGQCLQRIHFSMLTFRYWMTQPHIPIALRKRFLNINLNDINEENAQGRLLENSAQVSTPIDLKRSGLLHIRQFFPGPATLLDCDPPRLVKFIQRLSLEDLLEADRCNHVKSGNHGGYGGLLDLQHIEDLSPEVRQAQREAEEVLREVGRHSTAPARSVRSLKNKDQVEHSLLEVQQRLMEALLLHHTLRLVEKARDVKQAERWTTFSRDSPDGQVRATCTQATEEEERRRLEGEQLAEAEAQAKRGKRGRRKSKKAQGEMGEEAADPAPAALDKVPLLSLVPCFSENLGPHCTRGDACPFFSEGLCLPQKVDSALAARDNHLFTLPSSATSRKVVWWAEGMRTVRDLLHSYKAGTLKLTAPQLRYAKAVTEGMVAINPGEIDHFFAKLRYPVFIIDFEAVQFALPPFQKVVAYQSVPFQFSLDVFQHDILTEEPTHYDFLHFGKGYSPNSDPRRSCIQELMSIVRAERAKKEASMRKSGELDRFREVEEAGAQATGKRGAKKKAPKVTKNNPLEQPLTPYDGCFIAHFASFEKSCLEKLGQLEEGFKEEIRHFYFLDTMDLFKKGFIHPNAQGSNSLKKVLPAMCPDFQYGVFGSEGVQGGDETGGISSSGDDDSAGGSQDEQKGENAMGVYRLWYHQEGGGTLQDLQRSTAVGRIQAAPGRAVETEWEPGVRTTVPKEARERIWATLRIQLLEYCSLDTKALYEIMREIWKERKAVRGVPPADKSGWVYAKPTAREVSL